MKCSHRFLSGGTVTLNKECEIIKIVGTCMKCNKKVTQTKGKKNEYKTTAR